MKNAHLLLGSLVIVALLFLGFAKQNKIPESATDFGKRIALLEAEIAELKSLLGSKNEINDVITNPDPGKKAGPRAFLDGTRGWDEDGTNIWTSAGAVPSYSVGIGTTNPQKKLHVEGDGRVDNLWLADTPIPTIAFGASAEHGFIQYMNNSIDIVAKTSRDIRLGTHNSYDDVVIDTLGNVGIGTTTPTERLDIQDGSGNGAIRVGNTANTNTGTIRWNGSNFQGRNASNWVDLDASGGADNDWVRGELPGLPDTILCTYSFLGLARGGAGNAAYSLQPETHVNFGVECTTGAGANNWVYCTISGGWGNNATWSYSTVGGGYLNEARQAFTTIGGGQGNSISSGGSHSTIAGGYNNTANGTRSFIGGGMDNTTAGTYSTIGGGYGNTVTSSGFSRSTIAGGQLNTISSEYSAIPGGRDNDVSGDYAFAFGRGVIIPAAADYHSVFYSAAYPGSLLVNGDLRVTGTVSKGGGSFLIDHPLDPENKTLRHNFVESPENLCLYRGKVTLDNTGKETVKMPDYFKALTKEDEATITLTSIGRPFNTGYEWNKYFTEFTVYGESGREVSYIVLADRDDPVMRKLYHPVEEEKGNGNFVKGKLLYPEAYGYPVEMSVDYHPEDELEELN